MDAASATIEVIAEAKAAADAPPEFSLGEYFDQFSTKMLKTVPPTCQF